MESLPKACLQHPGYRQINYEAPNPLKKNQNPLPANSNEPLSLSFPSAYHLNHTIMPPLGTCTHSLTVFFFFSRKHHSSIICRPSSIYALACFLQSPSPSLLPKCPELPLAPFPEANEQYCPANTHHLIGEKRKEKNMRSES